MAKRVKGFKGTTAGAKRSDHATIADDAINKARKDLADAEAEVAADKAKPLKKDNAALTNKNIMANLGDAPYVVFALDSTGSMSSCIQECRNNLRDLISQLLQDNPRTRVGFVLFGDYIDEQHCISIKDFCNNADEIIEFINNTSNTSGGDIPECYELVLNRVADMDWTEEGGALVLVGDALPHPTQDPDPINNPEHLDWEKEIQRLLTKKVKVFPCQCLYAAGQSMINDFWSKVADLCQTPLLKMDFQDSSYTLASVAYASVGGSDGLRSFSSKGHTIGFAAASAKYSKTLETLTSYTASLDKSSSTGITKDGVDKSE